MCEMGGELGPLPFWEGRISAKRDFPWYGRMPKAVALVLPRTSRVAEVSVECVSNVIYQKAYVLRLFFVSDI